MHSQDDLLSRRDRAAVEDDARRSTCCGPDCCDDSRMQRRTFVKMAGIGAATLATTSHALPAIAGPFTPEDLVDHCVPARQEAESRLGAAVD